VNTDTAVKGETPPRARKAAVLDPTGDPRKMVDAVAGFVRDRGFNDAQADLKDYFRACLRIARRQGRQEVLGRK